MSKEHFAVGLTIKKVRKATPAELEAFGWEADCGRHGKPTVLELSDGKVLMASRDPEGNGPGALGYVELDKTDNVLAGYFFR
jgi:hypothetical protein